MSKKTTCEKRCAIHPRPQWDEVFWHDSINVYYDIIVFFMDGKIIMECYRDIFHYFEHMIRLQKDKHPVAGAVKVVISF